MLSIDPNQQTVQENYKLLIGSIIPRPVAFVTTLAEDGTLNGAPFSYFSIVASDPPMISVSVQRQNGRQKDTARNSIAKKEFVVHIVDDLNVEKVNATAASLPPNESEISLVGMTPIKSEKVSVPGVKESKVRFECVLEHAIPLGNPDSPGSDLLLGRVVQFHIDEEIYDDGRILADKLGAISRLAGNDFAKIGEVFSIERPK